ncbi:unnamed protein product [Polarella glacialis]|uniref:FAD-binding PCMH-type domain-containing protein n=1 Tax=Polarella glacialis TaxID=89957 RepID=A0A813LXC7_POLGL|nr:unnamed protein product [Polarella glacialis]CAE8737522.1 unnamed protein product [Polarella glacialis]
MGGFQGKIATTPMAPEDIVSLEDQERDKLRKAVTCEVITPDMKQKYLEARGIWNLDASGFPLAFVMCKTTEDVSATVQYAKAAQLQICVRTAGAHSSHAVVDNVLCINLSLMRKVTVTSAGTAEVEGGAMIQDVDDACAPSGMALPMGHVSHTGVAGMLLNATSGVGYMCRTRGLCGNFLLEATMVMHDGRVLTVNAKENEDLFWGLPGAGANFGIATRLSSSSQK